MLSRGPTAQSGPPAPEAVHDRGSSRSSSLGACRACSEGVQQLGHTSNPAAIRNARARPPIRSVSATRTSD